MLALDSNLPGCTHVGLRFQEELARAEVNIPTARSTARAGLRVAAFSRTEIALDAAVGEGMPIAAGHSVTCVDVLHRMKMTRSFVMFFTLLLVTASKAVNDPRWQLPKARFREFLEDNVPIDRGIMRGRDVLIHIAMLPVTHAIAGTLIGLVWAIARAGCDRFAGCSWPRHRQYCDRFHFSRSMTEQLAAAGANYLAEEIRKRVADGAVRMKLKVQVAEPGDKVDNPSIAARRAPVVHRKRRACRHRACRPMITVRSQAYPISFARRHGAAAQ